MDADGLLYEESLATYAGNRCFRVTMTIITTALILVALTVPWTVGLRDVGVYLAMPVLVFATFLIWLGTLRRQRLRIYQTMFEPRLRPLKCAFSRSGFSIRLDGILDVEITPREHASDWLSSVTVTLSTGRRLDLNYPSVGPKAYPFLIEFVSRVDRHLSAAPAPEGPTAVVPRLSTYVLLTSIVSWAIFTMIVILMTWNHPGSLILTTLLVLATGISLLALNIGVRSIAKRSQSMSSGIQTRRRPGGGFS